MLHVAVFPGSTSVIRDFLFDLVTKLSHALTHAYSCLAQQYMRDSATARRNGNHQPSLSVASTEVVPKKTWCKYSSDSGDV